MVAAQFDSPLIPPSQGMYQPCDTEGCPGPVAPGNGLVRFYTFHDRNGDGAPNEGEPDAEGTEIIVIGEAIRVTLRTNSDGWADTVLANGRYSVRWDNQEWDIDVNNGTLLVFLPVHGTPVTVFLPLMRGH